MKSVNKMGKKFKSHRGFCNWKCVIAASVRKTSIFPAPKNRIGKIGKKYRESYGSKKKLKKKRKVKKMPPRILIRDFLSGQLRTSPAIPKNVTKPYSRQRKA